MLALLTASSFFLSSVNLSFFLQWLGKPCRSFEPSGRVISNHFEKLVCQQKNILLFFLFLISMQA